MGGFQGLVHGSEQAGVDGIGAGRVLQPGGEGGDGLVGVVAGPVEPPVHGALDPLAQRVKAAAAARVDTATATAVWTGVPG